MLVSASIRVRLTLWYVLVLAVILAAFGAGVYLTLRHILHSNLDESIQNQASALLTTFQLEDGRLNLTSGASLADSEQGEHFVRVFNTSRQLTFDNSAEMGVVPVDLSALDGALAGKSEARRFKVGDDAIRARTFPIQRNGQVVGVLEVGQSEDDVSDTLGALLIVLAVAYPLTLVVASFGGAFLAGRALSPIDKITGLAREITAEGLGQRLNLQLPDDEIGRLARTFDEMISRLDDAFRHQRQFTADASHELRTPLTVMKGEIDVALQRERDPDAYRQALQTVNEEVDRMIRLAESLLMLARADSSQIPMAMESISVEDVVNGAYEHVRQVGIQRGLEMRYAPGEPATIYADEDFLLQLLLNLLDNAIKYTPAGGSVAVGWNLREEHVELWVRDTGIGISKEHLPHLFDRFYRVDKARSRAEGGVGLGLAISQWIVHGHGGSIHVESTLNEGATFSVFLPRNNLIQS